MRNGSLAAVVATLVGVLLAACADSPGGEGDAASTPTAPTAPTASPGPTGTPGPTPSGPTPPPVLPTLPSPPVSPPGKPPPSDRSVPITLTGQVIEGVEAGCRLLQTGEKEYLLLGEAAEDLRIGTTATVRGQVRTDVMSICQQGTPFQVSEVLPDRGTG